MTQTNRSSRLAWRGALLAGLLASTALAGLAIPGLAAPANAPTEAAAPLHPVPDFADLVARVTPAVVSITTEIGPRIAGGANPMAPGHMMRGVAKGSGFIIDADGTVVTNAHVVAGAQSVRVALSDGTELPAKVIGRDTRTDLAVLKVKADHKLPWLELGHSAEVRPGEWVVAVGNPFGLGGTVTAGIVSARGRDIGAGPYDDFLQIDAPINRGNSGGPLFTQDGRVVGVNTAILSPSGGSIGIGFAIPADKVRTVVAALEKDGHVTRGFLGVETQRLDKSLAAALRLPANEGAHGPGALVASVTPDSPAAKAGLRPGDVIQAVDGKPIGSPRDLANGIAGDKPGSVAELAVMRDGEKQTVQVTLAAQPEATDVADNAAMPHGQHQLGVGLAGLTPELRDRLNLPDNTRGVVIANVAPDSPAARAGLREGDVLLGVGHRMVETPHAAVAAIRAATKNGQTVALRIMRDGQAGYVAVKPGGTASPDDGSDDGATG
jgi:serine protease Do